MSHAVTWHTVVSSISNIRLSWNKDLGIRSRGKVTRRRKRISSISMHISDEHLKAFVGSGATNSIPDGVTSSQPS